MIAETTALSVLALAALAEWLHRRRVKRVGRLAFGPAEKPRPWTTAVPFARTAALAALAWGLVTLFLLGATSVKSKPVPDGGWRHLVIAWDVSPSMQLEDAGPGRKLTRAKRASELVMSLLERIALDQVRVSIVAFYTEAKPVVVDTMDQAVVKNILDDLPLDMAFDRGKTKLIDGVRASVELARPWARDSTTLLVVSDGDTMPDSGLPPLPASVAQVLVLGVGDAASGKYIDGHQSRQDASTLRQLATRLRGTYHDGNEKHLPSGQLGALATVMALRDEADFGRRQAALAAVGVGGGVLALIPVALALFGSGWQPAARSGKEPFVRSKPTGITEPESVGTKN